MKPDGWGRGGELTRTRDGDKSSTNTTAPFLSWFKANRSPDPKFSTNHVLRTQHGVSQEPNVENWELVVVLIGAEKREALSWFHWKLSWSGRR